MDKINDLIRLTPLARVHTAKGDVLHAMKITDAGYAGFGEVYFSEVLPGSIKGWKRHREQTLNLVVVKGTIRFSIYDSRETAPTYGSHTRVLLSPDGLAAADVHTLSTEQLFATASTTPVYARLTVPPGVWLAFEGVDEQTSILMDIIPQVHDPNESDRCELEEIDL